MCGELEEIRMFVFVQKRLAPHITDVEVDWPMGDAVMLHCTYAILYFPINSVKTYVCTICT
jgi:hypothetical protein